MNLTSFSQIKYIKLYHTALRAALIIMLLSVSSVACAATQPGDIMNTLVEKFHIGMHSWASTFQAVGNYLLIALASISLIWRCIALFFRTNNLNDIFFECVRTVMIVGFFLWVMNNVQTVIDPIIRGFQQLAGQAVGAADVSPSGMITNGTKAVSAILGTLNDGWLGVELSPDTLIKVVLALVIMTIFVLIAVNLLLVTVSLYFIAYSGVFILALGGSDWTRHSALNYFTVVLAGGVRYLGMVLMAALCDGVFQSCLNDYIAASLEESWMPLVTMFCASLVVYLLITKLPEQLASIVSSVGSGSGVSASGFLAATGMAAAAGTIAGAAKSMAKSAAAYTGGAAKSSVVKMAAMADTAGRNLSGTYAATSDQMNRAAQKAAELFGAASGVGGINQAAAQHDFQRQGFGKGTARQMAQQADQLVRKAGFGKDEALDEVSQRYQRAHGIGTVNTNGVENSISGVAANKTGSAANATATAGAGGTTEPADKTVKTKVHPSEFTERQDPSHFTNAVAPEYPKTPDETGSAENNPAFKYKSGVSAGNSYQNFDDPFKDPATEDPVRDQNLHKDPF